MTYTGQTGRPFRTRCQEHFRDFKYNNNKSKFAQHLLDNKHPLDTIETIMNIVHITRKGKTMNTTENFHIYKETRCNNQINDKLTVREKAIFETVIQKDPYRGLATPPHPNKEDQDRPSREKPSTATTCKRQLKN
jgi:hypothetical protein